MAATRTTTMQPVESVTVTCDFCGDEIGGLAPEHGATCIICRRHACYRHRVKDPEDWSDNPRTYCRDCWEVGEEHRGRIAELENEIDRARMDWRAAGQLIAEAAKENQR